MGQYRQGRHQPDASICGEGRRQEDAVAQRVDTVTSQQCPGTWVSCISLLRERDLPTVRMASVRGRDSALPQLRLVDQEEKDQSGQQDPKQLPRCKAALECLGQHVQESCPEQAPCGEAQELVLTGAAERAPQQDSRCQQDAADSGHQRCSNEEGESQARPRRSRMRAGATRTVTAIRIQKGQRPHRATHHA